MINIEDLQDVDEAFNMLSKRLPTIIIRLGIWRPLIKQIEGFYGRSYGYDFELTK